MIGESYGCLLQGELEVEQMSENDTKVFLQMAFAETEHKDLTELWEKLSGEFSVEVFKSRMESYGIPYTPPTAIYICTSCNNPAKIVMWCYTLGLLYKRGHKEATLTELSILFPFGFPTDKAMSEVWEAQKDPDQPLGNCLDNVDLVRKLLGVD